MARVRLRSGQAYEFACYSKACAPPPAGTGGSNPSGGSGGAGGSGGGSPSGDRFDQEVEYEQAARAKARGGAIITNASDHPDYKKRTAQEVGAMSQEAAIALVREKDATGRRVLDKGVEPQVGDVVGVRANLNLKKSTGITVQTLHAGTAEQLDKGTGLFSGEAVGYGAAVVVSNPQFSVNQAARAKIYSKEQNKFPMASVDGRLSTHNNPVQGMFDGVEIKFNPMTGHLFTDPQGRAVKSATVATVVGSSVFVRGNITYWSKDAMPKPARDLPTGTRAYDE